MNYQLRDMKLKLDYYLKHTVKLSKFGYRLVKYRQYATLLLTFYQSINIVYPNIQYYNIIVIIL